jgi:hypothetical protein
MLSKHARMMDKFTKPENTPDETKTRSLNRYLSERRMKIPKKINQFSPPPSYNRIFSKRACYLKEVHNPILHQTITITPVSSTPRSSSHASNQLRKIGSQVLKQPSFMKMSESDFFKTINRRVANKGLKNRSTTGLIS